MSDETQPFDQATYDELRRKFPADEMVETGWCSGYREGWFAAAREAARLAAARSDGATPVVGEVELADAFFAAYSTHLNGTTPEHNNVSDPRYYATIAGIRAILAAQAVQVPDWVTHWKVIPNGEHGPGFTVYTNIDTTSENHYFDTWGYHPTDPMQALAKAIAAKGGQE